MRNVENLPKPRVNNRGITKCVLTEVFIGKDLKILGSYTPSEKQICPGSNANEIQTPYAKHHQVSSLKTHNSVKFEVK